MRAENDCGSADLLAGCRSQPYETPASLSVFLCEDHALVREGLRALLLSDSRIAVVGESGSAYDAIRLIEVLKPALMLTDLSMPGINGIEAIHEIKRRHPAVKIIVLTMHNAEEHVRAALKAGANGYVLKDATRADLMAAIRSVMQGNIYLSAGLPQTLATSYVNREVGKEISPWETLTHRERMVLKLIAEGLQNKKIADYLCISTKTVEKHRANLMKKLDLHNAAAITAFAIERQLVTQEARAQGSGAWTDMHSRRAAAARS